MKKLILCALAGAMVFSLAACGNADSEKTGEETTGEEAAQTEAEEESEAEDTAGQEAEEDDDARRDEEGTAGRLEDDADADAEETNEQEAAEAADVPDVSAAVSGTATSEAEAVPVGTWVKTSLYSTQDSTFHTVYVRVTKVTTQSADAAYVESAIATNDKYASEEEVFDSNALEVPDDGELVVLDYEVYVPADFPAASYGMPEPRLYFSIRNIGGGGISSTDGSSTYVGLGTTVELIVRDPEEVYEPGHVYSERCIFAMVNGYTNYEAVYSSYPEGTDGAETVIDNLYTVYHAVK